MSTLTDAQAILDFLATCFMDRAEQTSESTLNTHTTSHRHSSCASCSIPEEDWHCSSATCTATSPHSSSASKHSPRAVRVDARCSHSMPDHANRAIPNASVVLAPEQQSVLTTLPSSSAVAAAAASLSDPAASSASAAARTQAGSTLDGISSTAAAETAADDSWVTKRLSQLSWITTGDLVTAWTASQLQSRLMSHLHASTSQQSDSCPTRDSLHPAKPASQGTLQGIWVYPIKSCGGTRVLKWPLGPNGLLLDREWALVGDDGMVLTQKGLPKLALVQPRVDLAQGVMQVIQSLDIHTLAWVAYDQQQETACWSNSSLHQSLVGPSWLLFDTAGQCGREI